MSDAPGWAVPAMRIGFVGRGLTYAVTGALAVSAALHNSQADGTTDALRQLRNSPWGLAALAVIAGGLACYGIFRLAAAALDLDAHGGGAKGAVARLGLVASGVIHLGLGLYAGSLLLGLRIGGGGEDGGSARTATEWLMHQPYGVWAVAAIGLVVIGAGGYYVHKGVSGNYRCKLHGTPLTRKLDIVLRYGVMAQGVVVGVIGLLLGWAAWTYDPDKAGGLGQALAALRTAAFGQALLLAVAVGLIAFALFCLVMAVYGLVPRCRSDETPTLARRLEVQAGG
ncbi:DUF1206 domain-containing protein [Albimonas sp. CAU 1670]|uniref:DUF1206 domain-containing protein n=1 Tax=Albimonas sp. CAU 1670 TaxID=3032599 RepID=UPI0023DB2FA5|nr:DUF1206 domain-containing protein [Albimonas sp. CAU 1670]MDF2231881.1 DUF1206 domain-containing protein [Albimonas sp. CAU 1670]